MPWWERLAALVVGAGSGLAVAITGASPTTSVAADRAWSFALGVVVALAATQARRRVLLVVAAVATVGAWGVWSLAGALALMLASGVVVQRRGVVVGERLMHALSASLALEALAHMGGSWFPLWVAALIAAFAIAAVLVAGWMRSPRWLRIPVAVGVVAGVAVLGVAGVSVWRLMDRVSLADATALASDGTLASLDDLAASADDFAAAEQRLADLRRGLDSGWFAPLAFVPVAAQQMHALNTIIDAGLNLANQAGDGAALVEGAELRPAPGKVDVVAMRALEAPLADMAASLQLATTELRRAASPLLVGPVRDATERLATATAEALPATELALLGVQTVPGMLGADGPRRWLIQLIDTETGTSEWQMVIADEGRLIPSDQFGRWDAIDNQLIATKDSPASTIPVESLDTFASRVRTSAGIPFDGFVRIPLSGAQSLLTGQRPGNDTPEVETVSISKLVSEAASMSPAWISSKVTGNLQQWPTFGLWSARAFERPFLDRLNQGKEAATGLLPLPDQSEPAPSCATSAVAGVPPPNSSSVGGLICIGNRAVIWLLDGNDALAGIEFLVGRDGTWKRIERWRPEEVGVRQLPEGFTADDLAYFTPDRFR